MGYFDKVKPLPAAPEPPVEAANPPADQEPEASLVARSKHLISIAAGLVFGFLFFYLLADWSSFTTGQQRLGQLVFSNTMTQLWTAAYRLTFIVAVALLLIRLFIPSLFTFWRADTRGRLDLENAFSSLTRFQQVCVFLAVFFGFCYLFVALLQVSLPESVSVGP